MKTSTHRTAPDPELQGMPPGIPYIICNEAAERFSFYGMRTILVVFMAKYLWIMDGRGGTPMSETEAVEHYHAFVAWVYFTPLFGALLSDILLGKYRTIILLSIVYCLGHAALACMGSFGHSGWWLFSGLLLICLGSGGIKPCVSAHVGDQFGKSNSHLLTRIYNWFYFSINLGSFISTLLTPWLLEWYGPHWAFGIPGVLMALATLLFWMGRHKFIHVPPGGMKFFRELFSLEGLAALGKLTPLFMFIAAFWALFDQTGSSWVFQAGQMDRKFLGITWLESQIQALNPILILTFIPLFTFIIYPALNRVFKLTPLRKIGLGLFIMAASFALVTLIQRWIDAGESPSVAWQLLAYVIITASEILVSIVALEFAYTQAPRNLKSMIMSIFLLSVFAGNKLTEQINSYIQIPSASTEQFQAAKQEFPDERKEHPQQVTLAGFDQIAGTEDDFIAHIEDGALSKLEIPGQAAFEQAAQSIEELTRAAGHKPASEELNGQGLGMDPWGNPIRYKIINSTRMRLMSAGADKTEGTEWDLGMTIAINKPDPPREESWYDFLVPEQPWLDQHKAKLGIEDPHSDGNGEITYARTTFCGGQTKLEGASYFAFFTGLMLATAVVFVPFAAFYRPRTYLQE